MSKSIIAILNFGLWYNKYIPIIKPDIQKDPYKTCDNQGKTNSATTYYISTYDNTIKNNNLIAELLKNKHTEQVNFLFAMKNYYNVLEIKATTMSPLITGIGESHPSEIGMTFDHTIGIPYIPASSIKGLLRFTTVLQALKNNTIDLQNMNNKIDDEKIHEVYS